MIAIIEICYRNYAHYTLYRSCLPIYGIAIIRSLSFSFPDDFEGTANISVAIKSGSTVVIALDCTVSYTILYCIQLYCFKVK